MCLDADDDDQDGRAPLHDAAGPRRPSGVGGDDDNGNAKFFDITEVLACNFLQRHAAAAVCSTRPVGTCPQHHEAESERDR